MSITVSTFSDLQAAIAAHEPDIRISGAIVGTGQILNVSQSLGTSNQLGMSVISGGTIRCAGIIVDGFRRIKFKELELYAEGIGLLVRNGIMITVEDVYTCCGSDSVRLDSVAAYVGRGEQHTSSLASPTSVAMRIGNSPQGYESVDSDGMLVEGHMQGVRIGGAGNNVNMWFKNTRVDRPGNLVNGAARPGSCAFHVGPSGSANARNINIRDIWVNGADYPILLEVTGTTGRIDRVNVSNGEYLGCVHSPVYAEPTNNNPSRINYNLSGQQVIGPLEPGT